jgi:hypothetical protein
MAEAERHGMPRWNEQYHKMLQAFLGDLGTAIEDFEVIIAKDYLHLHPVTGAYGTQICIKAPELVQRLEQMAKELP